MSPVFNYCSGALPNFRSSASRSRCFDPMSSLASITPEKSPSIQRTASAACKRVVAQLISFRLARCPLMTQSCGTTSGVLKSFVQVISAQEYLAGPMTLYLGGRPARPLASIRFIFRKPASYTMYKLKSRATDNMAQEFSTNPAPSCLLALKLATSAFSSLPPSRTPAFPLIKY